MDRRFYQRYGAFTDPDMDRMDEQLRAEASAYSDEEYDNTVSRWDEKVAREEAAEGERILAEDDAGGPFICHHWDGDPVEG